MKTPRTFFPLILLTLGLSALFVLIFVLSAFPSQAAPQGQDMVITGVIDGPLSGGVPKAVEFYVINDISDLSIYGFGSANNGGGSDGQEFTFPAVSASAGQFIYVASETTGFNDFFGFDPDYTSNAASINGDDAIELFENGVVIDVFGEINVDGTGQPWEYTDGWAYRNDGTGPDGSSFVLANWYFSGPNALDGETSNSTAATPFPIGSYVRTSGSPTPTPSGTPPTPTPTPTPTATPAPGACSTIPQIQGTGYSSPCLGHRDNIEGCITGVTSRGFYFQDVNGDGDPASSDGIYAYFYKGWTNPSNYQPGDLVRVSGNVTEYYDTTEFAHSGSDPLSVTRIGSCTLPTPVTIAPIADPNADPMALYERYEGMRVQMSFNGFVVGPTKRFVSDHPAGDPEIAFVDQSSSIYGQRVFEADYPGYQGMNYISGAFNKDLPDVDFGDQLAATDLVGVLGYQFDKYTLMIDGQMTQSLTVTDDVDAEDAETAAGDEEFTLCTFNIENMFDTIDDGDGDMGDWVPADTTEYNRMLEKRAKAIATSLANCAVIGVQEVEGKDPVWDDLVAAISAQGGIGYAYDYYESVDPRDITTGILYDPARVTLNASYQKQGCTATDYGVNYSNADNTYGRAVANPCASGTYPLFNRPPYLAQLTLRNAAGDRSVDVSVIVNHFKSKRGDESVNLPRREAQAQHVVSLMQEEYDAGRPNSVALGDFNDVLGSSTLAQFDTNVGGQPLVNLYLVHVPENDRYSYIFSGESEVLDHFIATTGLDGYFMAGRAVHINADYPDVGNMDTDNCSGCIFSAGATSPQDATVHRSSDHDPVHTRFSLCQILNAPATVDIAINAVVNGVDLSWSAVTSSDHYQVWESADPYLAPDTRNDTPLDTTTLTSYTHAGSLGDPATQHFYLVTTVNACGAASGYSQRVGEFDFALTPGN